MSIYGAQAVDSPRHDDAAQTYDALLFLSFGGPEGMDDVMPFLRNVSRGRNIPDARLAEVAHHYEGFGGISPINAQNRALIAAMEADFAANGLNIPIYFGNRNWHPMVTDTITQMKADGIKRVLVFVTSAFSCYSGCRQYREDVTNALELLQLGKDDIQFDKIRVYYNHPDFIGTMVTKTNEGLAKLPESDAPVHLVFTAHSIPNSMAAGSDYEVQLKEASRLVAEEAGVPDWSLVYQSRSGPPQIPWLEPDVCDYIDTLAEQGVKRIAIIPIGFISDHMEVLFDLDNEALSKAAEVGIDAVRISTVGTDPRFVGMIRQLVVERMTESPERKCMGCRGPNHDVCPVGCCAKGESARPRPAANPVS